MAHTYETSTNNGENLTSPHELIHDTDRAVEQLHLAQSADKEKGEPSRGSLDPAELLLRNPKVLLDRVSIRGVGEEAKSTYADLVQRGVELGVIDRSHDLETAEDEIDMYERIEAGTWKIQLQAHQQGATAASPEQQDAYYELAEIGSKAFTQGVEHAARLNTEYPTSHESERRVGSLEKSDVRYFRGNTTAALKNLERRTR